MTENQVNLLYKQLGLNIRNARKEKGFSQEDFAKLINLSRASVVNIEMGRQRPSLHLLLEIANITEFRLENFLPDFSNTHSLEKWNNVIENASNGNELTHEKLTKFLAHVTSKNI